MIISFINKCLVDFVLFSGIEGFISSLFFYIIGKHKKFRLKEIVLLSFGNCIISQIFPPIIYQTLIFIWMGFFLYLTKRTKFIQGLKLSFLVMFYTLICEMSIGMVYEFILNVKDFSSLSPVDNFITMIPIRIAEIFGVFVIEYINKRRKLMESKFWYGEIDKRKK